MNGDDLDQLYTVVSADIRAVGERAVYLVRVEWPVGSGVVRTGEVFIDDCGDEGVLDISAAAETAVMIALDRHGFKFASRHVQYAPESEPPAAAPAPAAAEPASQKRSIRERAYALFRFRNETQYATWVAGVVGRPEDEVRKALKKHEIPLLEAELDDLERVPLEHAPVKAP